MNYIVFMKNFESSRIYNKRLIGTVREKHIPNQRFSGYVNNKRIEGNRIVIKQLT